MKDLTVNWHITEACNLKCRYCFAKWDKVCKKELLQDFDKVLYLLDEIATLPRLFEGNFTGIRLNLVGGETFLYKKQVFHIIREAKKRGMKLSAITNGTKLDDEINEIIAHYFDIIGFSVDSLNYITNLKIGRASEKSGIKKDELLTNILKVKHFNPNIGIKINTVVNKFNYQEYLGDFLDLVKPDKWKVFKMLPVTPESRDLAISDEQFKVFLANHHCYRSILYDESNEDMTHSYLMIDPLGRFFQNSAGREGYDYSDSINEVGIQKAFSQIKFDKNKFLLRYNKD